MVITSNIIAMNAQRQYNIVGHNKKKSLEKLSSGYKINRASDDAAGLAISEKMRRQIRGLTQGVKNTQDGVSMCQIADGALDEVSAMLHRITELSVKSANDTNTPEDRHAIQSEINAILKEINRVSASTTFNEQKLFGLGLSTESGSYALSSMAQLTNDEIIEKIMNGSFPTVTKDIELDDVGGILKVDKANDIVECLGKSFIYMDEMLGNKYTFPSDKAKIETIFWKAHDDEYNYAKSEYEQNSNYNWEDSYYYQEWQQADAKARNGFETNDRSQFFNNTTHVTYYGSNWGTALCSIAAYIGTGDAGNMMLTASALAGPVYGYSFGDNVSNVAGKQKRNGEFYDLCYQMNITGYASNYESKKSVVCDIYRYIYSRQEASSQSTTPDNEHEGVWIQSGTESGDGIWLKIESVNTSILGISGIDVSSQSGAHSAIELTKEAVKKVSEVRSNIGAQQNRLEHTIANEENIVENTSAAESRIRDTDMGKESVSIAIQNILAQAGTAMIAQANQTPQSVLQLLR